MCHGSLSVPLSAIQRGANGATAVWVVAQKVLADLQKPLAIFLAMCLVADADAGKVDAKFTEVAI